MDMTDDQIIAENLNSARRHLAHALTNQGIDWDEACDECEQIEDRIRAKFPTWGDESITSELGFAACRYVDM